MTTVPVLISSMPVVSTLAALFYIVVLGYFLVPRFRYWIDSTLSMPTPSTHNYISSLDSFRGLAALLVATFHCWQWTQPLFDPFYQSMTFLNRGAKAVPIFVILSGFLVYRALLRVKNPEQLRRYALRRFLRLYPLYAATVLAALLMGLFNERMPVFQHLLGDLTMIRMFGFDFLSNPPAWSLYVEILFYLIAPLLVSTFSPLSKHSRIRLYFFSVIVLILADFTGPRELGLWKYFFFGFIASELTDLWEDRWDEGFAIGIFLLGLALLILDLGFGEVWFSNLVNMIFTKNGLIVIMPRGGGANPEFTFGLGLAAMFLVIGASLSRGRLSKLLAVRPLHFLGVISYSIFMWHGFVILADLPLSFHGDGSLIHLSPISMVSPSWFLPAVMIPAILAASLISFIVIERTFLKFRPKSQDKLEADSVRDT